MGGVIQETIHERQRQGAPRVDLQLENLQLREQLGFAVREIHPMERRCDGPGDHALGPLFYGVHARPTLGARRKYSLFCPDCYEHYVTSQED